MANLSNGTKFANRYGLDVKVYQYDDGSVSGNALITIDFANVSDIEISGDRVWATGGRDHANKIGFDNPVQGTFKLSTQILTTQLLALIAGERPGWADPSAVIFKNESNSAPMVYTIRAATVWQDDDGNVYNETITFHKALPKKALNISYNGDGDPTSVDIEFDLLQDDSNKVLTIEKQLAPVKEYSVGVSYAVGDICKRNLSNVDYVYICTTAIASAPSSFNTTHWSEITQYSNSHSGGYAVGDYCLKDGYLYKCKTQVVEGSSWSAAKWDAIASITYSY